MTDKLLSSKLIYAGKILNLRVDTIVLPGGVKGNREVVESAGAVAVVPVNEFGELLMVKQYRHPVGKTMLEIPAGRVEPGENLEQCAMRELLEETGYEAKKIIRLLSFYSTPGFATEEIHICLATGLLSRGQNLDEEEDIEVLNVSYGKALEMIWSGEICDAKTVVGIFSAQELLHNILQDNG